MKWGSSERFNFIQMFSNARERQADETEAESCFSTSVKYVNIWSTEYRGHLLNSNLKKQKDTWKHTAQEMNELLHCAPAEWCTQSELSM